MSSPHKSGVNSVNGDTCVGSICGGLGSVPLFLNFHLGLRFLLTSTLVILEIFYHDIKKKKKSQTTMSDALKKKKKKVRVAALGRPGRGRRVWLWLRLLPRGQFQAQVQRKRLEPLACADRPRASVSLRQVFWPFGIFSELLSHFFIRQNGARGPFF